MRKGTILKAGLITLCALAVLVAGLLILRQQEADQYQEKRGEMSEGFGQLKTVTWKGETYREKPAVTTLLFAGIDKVDDSTDTTANAYRNGGQADFLLLMAIDHTDKQIHQLQIDRDTMTDVVTLGMFGNETGTRNMQICLAHSYGKTPLDNAQYTIRAVQNLLDGLEIDGYYIMSYSAIPALNDALGGVTVHLDYDMIPVHENWTKGSTVTLHGKEAEDFVRARMTVGAGTNEERMVRQNEFMQQAIAQLNRKIKADLEFGESLLKQLQDVSVTNMSVKRLEQELSKAYNYEVLAVDHPAGEYKKGDDGFTEFHMRDGAAVEWVLENIYTKQE